MAHTDLAACNRALELERGRSQRFAQWLDSEIARLADEVKRLEYEKGALESARATLRGQFVQG